MQPLHTNEINNLNALKISIPRLPFGDRSNVDMPKRKISKQISTKKCLTSKKNKSKPINHFLHVARNKNIPLQNETSTNRENRILKDNKYHQNMENNLDASSSIKHNINFQKELCVKLYNNISKDITHKPTSNKTVNSTPQRKCNEKSQKDLNKDLLNNTQSIEATSKRLTIPLTRILRKGTVKHYLESTLEESTNQCTHDKSKAKVPIYRQQIPMLTNNNPKDPYALDIFDTKERKQKNRRSSAKFNKTIYNIMEKIEKKERKIIKKKKVNKTTPRYDEKILHVMKNVLHKVKERECNSSNNESYSSNPPLELETSAINKSSHLEIEDGFRGFDNSERTISTISQLHLTNFLEKYVKSVPGLSQYKLNNSRRIHIISNICLEPIKNSQITKTVNDSHLSTTHQDIETNKMSITSEVNPLDKSRNLQREFDDNLPDFNEQYLNENYESDLDNYFEDTEVEDDEFFGFKDETDEEEIPKVHRFSYKKKNKPWRYQGFFKRIPHMLIIKKNGLPCKEQEMVLDYAFVQRIEALCTKKSVDTSHVKEPVQTSILHYVESAHNEQDEPIRPSLFDYDEFNVDKVPRKVLGVIQSNKIISTPTKHLEADIRSPDVSIIPTDENEENHPLKTIKNIYQRKRSHKKKDENRDILKENVLPSILENKYEGPQDDLHLFEDVDQEKDTDFSIKLPIYKKTRRKRLVSEGSDDGMNEKKPKKKNKNMMTQAEESEFNAWADSMNARFAEDDKHELTIE